MRANGPRLSKGCINALIADGEVSKAEVQLQKEKLAGAKAKPKAADPKQTDVAAAKKAQPEAKKTDIAQKKAQAESKKTELAQKKPAPAEAKASAPKVAAAPQAPKPAAVARAHVPAQAVTPAREPERQTVSLDQKTFEALKNRGPRFLADTDSESIAAQPALAPSEPAPESGGNIGTAWQPQTQTEPAATEAVADGEALPAEAEPADVAEVPEDAGQNTIDYPPGRMSLGRKLPTATGEQPSNWWDQFVEAITGE
jgi:hypothetical protein